MSIPHHPWYHYSREDVGWGCVYRSYQNACVCIDTVTPTMEELLDVMWPDGLPESHRGRWIEPGQLRATLSKASAPWPCGGTTYVLLPRGFRDVKQTNLLQSSTEDEYDVMTRNPVDIITHVYDKGRPAIIDDGIMAYTIVRLQGSDHVLLLDPHTLEARHVPNGLFTPLELRRRLCERPWMVWCVEP
jgi:hypothetical protein